jgi:hypothetical protein
MSLPSGVINRPLVTTSPRVVGRVFVLTLVSLFVLLPLLVYIGAQVPGIKMRYECSRIEQKILDVRLERRRLLEERAKLVAPDRLRREAERLGLVPPELAERPGAPIPRRAPKPEPVP